MITLYIPALKDLWFRWQFLSDSETMSYNHAWGGSIEFVGEAAYHYDDIAIDNPAIDLFLKNGFREEYRTNEIIM